MTEQVTIRTDPIKPGVVKPEANPTVTDSQGRVLTLQEPDVLATYRLVRVVGAEAAENRVYINMILPLLYLKKIDTEDMFPPNTERQIDALIQRLGHDGVRTLRAGVEQYFSATEEKEENATIKKSPAPAR